MRHSFRLLLLPLLSCLALPWPSSASVIFKPGEKATYQAPGDEQMSGSVQQLFDKAQAAERNGDLKTAIKAYRVIIKKHPKDTLASGSCFRLAQLLEQRHDNYKAAEAYALFCDRYSKSDRFAEAVESLFRIGEMYLGGKKVKVLGITLKNSMDEAVLIFSMIIKTAPYGKYTARAQFDLGRAHEKAGSNEAAIAAYQSLVEKFPDDPLAKDAQYQIGYIWSKASRSGTYDPAAANNAKVGFEDFLARHPSSEKSAQAKENLKQLEHKQTNTSYDIARYYDKQKQYRAAAIYYNEVIRQQPGSTEGERAKKRISELRAKVGDAKLQAPAVTAAAANRKNRKPSAESNRSEGPPPSSNELAPLPPSDTDASLPPPASLLPDTTTAPPSSSLDSAAEPSASPHPSSPPEQSVRP